MRTAMALADERGIEAVTMRELGRRLGVEAASLYNHVSSKDDLLTGMAALVLAEIDLPAEGTDWREAMRRRAVSAREAFLRHRWAPGLIDSPRTGGLSSLSYADRVLGTLLEAGFSPNDAGRAFLALDSYVYGFERQWSSTGVHNETDGVMAAREVSNLIPDGTYPSLARVAKGYAAEPYDDVAAFEFGLRLLLDGLERHADKRRRGTRAG